MPALPPRPSDSLYPTPAPPQRSPLTQVGHQVDEAHQQESTHAEHHEQEKEQDGGHRLHSVVAEMPLGEAHVHQLPVEVIEGGLSSTQPGPPLLLLGARTPQGCAMTPIEKALEGEDREKQMNLERASVEVRCQAEGSPLGWALPTPTATQDHVLLSQQFPGATHRKASN